MDGGIVTCCLVYKYIYGIEVAKLTLYNNTGARIMAVNAALSLKKIFSRAQGGRTGVRPGQTENSAYGLSGSSFLSSQCKASGLIYSFSGRSLLISFSQTVDCGSLIMNKVGQKP